MKWAIFVGDLMGLYFTWGETFFKVRYIEFCWILSHYNNLWCKNCFRWFENHEIIAAIIILTFYHLLTLLFVFSFASFNIRWVLTELFLMSANICQFTRFEKKAVATFGWIGCSTFCDLFGRTLIQTYVFYRFLIQCFVTY
jgi:hypothetical protein